MAPISIKVRKVSDPDKKVGIALGLNTMLMTDSGVAYGTEYGMFQKEYSDWLRNETSKYSVNKKNNPGRKKYRAKKGRLEEKLHSYIGMELNRFIETEKPAIIYLPKYPPLSPRSRNKQLNWRISSWQRGYVTGHLEQKCMESGCEVVRVFGKSIGTTCSSCGAENKRRTAAEFVCSVCGHKESGQVNAARNALIRGQENE